MRKCLIKILIILCGLIFMPQLLLADSFRHLNIEQGLASRRVYRICKDSVGFVWFFTNMGVDRFDGTEVRHYIVDANMESKDHLLSATVMCCDRDGQLFIAFKNGKIYTYDEEVDAFHLFMDLAEHLMEPPTLNDIYFDKKNRFWICLYAGLYQLDRDKGEINKVLNIPAEYVMHMEQTETDTYFVGTNVSLYKIKENEDGLNYQMAEKVEFPVSVQVESLHTAHNKLYIGTFGHGLFLYDMDRVGLISVKDPIPFVPIRSIASTPDNRILIGTDGSGLYSMDVYTNRIINRYVADEDDRYSLSGNTVSDILIDETGCIWISTSTNGVSILDGQLPDIHWVKHGYMNKNSLASNHINILFEDSDGDIWYGTNNGVSLYKVKEDKWIHFLNDGKEDGHSSSVVLALCEDKNRNIWVGGYGIGVFCINKQTLQVKSIKRRQYTGADGISTNYIYTICADENSVWFGGIEGDLTRYNPEENKYTYYPINCIGDMQVGDGNTLYIASCGGLIMLDTNTGEYKLHNTLGETTLRYPIRCLRVNRDKEVWMASDGDGLIHFIPETGETKFYTMDEGLISNSIRSVQIDDTGRIWFTTEKTLYCLNPETGIIAGMNDFLGINWGYFNSNASICRKDGFLMMGTAEGGIEFTPPRFDLTEKDSLQLIFTDFRLFYKTVQPGAPSSPLKKAINETSLVKLKYNQSSFSLSFSAINYRASLLTEYVYKLEGFDTEWYPAEKNRIVNYTNITPGKYTFKVRALNQYTKEVIGEKSIMIRVARPFWASNIAILVYLVLLLIISRLVYLYIRNRIDERSSREKIDFFINIAHDIRTPVSLIKAPLTELEEQEELSAHAKKILSVAIRNAENLFSMVSQLLDFQKVDFSTPRLVVAPYRLNNYMQEKISAFSVMALHKGIDLCFEPDPDNPEVWFDRSRMNKIVDNILSNAVKYTREGNVTIRLSHTKNDWIIEVKDTGIGIPLNEQKNLFRKFYRAGNAINSQESGSGIGLLLTQKLVELHKGSITFTSVENQGSTFTLAFPLQPAPSFIMEEKVTTTSLQQEIMTASSPAGKETILLVEDNEDMRTYLTESLSRDYNVIALKDGSEALEEARRINPDIIISDIIMPGLRGDEMCRILKSSMETSHIPIILLSALNEKENVILGLESGAEDYILKPFDFSVLKVRIRNILQSREKLRKKILSIETGLEEVDYSNELDKEFLDRAIQVIEAELANPDFTINEFCRALTMSRTSVYNKMKTLTDQGPNEFIRIIRLNKARQLLKSKKYSISEVATMVGFADPKYFSTSYKKQFGVSPSKI